MCQELLVDGPKEGLRRAFSPRIFADLEPIPTGWAGICRAFGRRTRLGTGGGMMGVENE